MSPRLAELRFAEPRSAYVHIPFCRHRCGYCNFTLVAGRDDLIEPFRQALERELAALESVKELDTLYLGGGTPTHPSSIALAGILRTVRQWFALGAEAEFTLEANPADVDSEKLRVLTDFGVNRLSLGAQSFDPNKLRFLERDHDRERIESAANLARDARLSTSIDLIFGCPGETLEDWSRDLDRAIALQPDHLSCYGLTIERGSSFYGAWRQGVLMPLDENLEAAMFELAIDRLAAAGFEHYEVSNYALPGHRSRHNEAYWLGRTYFAAGPGAARFVAGRRETNHRSTTTYIRRVLAGESPVGESEMLSPDAAARERLVFGLRRLEGLDASAFHRETGFAVSELVGQLVDDFVGHGLLQFDGNVLQLTRRGLLVSDSIWPWFLQPTRRESANTAVGQK